MLVVHALWSPGRGVLLWAEDGERPATGRSRALRTARPHPFAAPAAALAALHPGTPTQVTLLLPAHAGGPLASPELVRSAPGPRPAATPELRPWAVPAVAVDAGELDDPADELRYGASVAHVRAVVAFADDLAAPRPRAADPGPGRAGARARWRPVVQGIDQAAVEALVATMPPVARAEARRHARSPADPAALVADALDVLVDAAVRDRLARAGVAHRGGQGAVDAWLDRAHLPRRPAARARRRSARWPRPCRRGTPSAPSRPAPPARVSGSPRSGPWPRNSDDTGDGTRWRLEFLLQSSTDPSLLVAATQVWAGAADRLIADPQEVLLAELGRAARVYPPLAARAADRPPRRARPEPGGRPPRARRRRRAARRRRVRGCSCPPAGTAPAGSGCGCPPAAPPRRASSCAAGWAASRSPPSAGRWPSATAPTPLSTRRRSPRSSRRRPRWCGCAGPG